MSEALAKLDKILEILEAMSPEELAAFVEASGAKSKQHALASAFLERYIRWKAKRDEK